MFSMRGRTLVAIVSAFWHLAVCEHSYEGASRLKQCRVDADTLAATHLQGRQQNGCQLPPTAAVARHAGATNMQQVVANK